MTWTRDRFIICSRRFGKNRPAALFSTLFRTVRRHRVSSPGRDWIAINRGEQQAGARGMIEETKDRYVDARLCSGTRAKGRADGTKKSSGEAHSGNGGIRETRARNLSGPPRTPATCLPDKNTTRNWAYSRGPPPPRLSLTIYWKNTLDTGSHCKHRASRYKFNIETAIRCLWSSRAHSSARLKCGVARG